MLFITKRTDARLLERMANHNSKPKGFVGRNICYEIVYNGRYYGHIVGGSATLFLQGRNEYLNIDKTQLNCVVNNIFFNINRVNGSYPKRNFTSYVIKEFEKRIELDWFRKYYNRVIGFETLIEKPRTGECYRRAGWKLVGETIGYTCKRPGGRGTDNWPGKRIWNTTELRPKLIYCKRNENYGTAIETDDLSLFCTDSH